ncbi:MAG: leucine-rich repeat protein [Ruminococcus sp.]|nr:leucine-rich repeat protein [Ruminococcus sp.]
MLYKYRKIISAVLSALFTAVSIDFNDISSAAMNEKHTDLWSYSLTDDGKSACLTGFDFRTAYENGYVNIYVPETIDGISVTDISEGILDGSQNRLYLFIPHNFPDYSSLLPYCDKHNIILCDDDDYQYILSRSHDNENYEISLFAYNGTRDYLYIPNEYDGFKVSGIYREFVLSKSDVKFAALPDTIRNIDEFAFAYTQLEYLNFPSELEKIDSYAFTNTRLTHLDIPASVKEIQKYAFVSCNLLKNVTISSDTFVEPYAFRSCQALENINIDLNSDIHGNVFSGCENLMMINGKKVVNDDGSPIAEYADFIHDNFLDGDNIGFMNCYAQYLARKFISEHLNDDMTDVEKIRIMHDWLCDNVIFDDSYSDSSYTELSPFLTGKTVCEGYARTMNLLLREAGFETCYVKNDTHAWIIVKVGGYYFHLDPTWDDLEPTVHSWFLCDDDFVRKETVHHTYWEIAVPNALHTSDITEVPVCNTLIGDVNHDNLINPIDAVYVLNEYSKVSLGSPMKLELVLADCNFNGKLDACDAAIIFQKYAEISSGL